MFRMLQLLYLMSLFGPMLVTGQFTCLDPDWSLFGASCYKIEGTLTYEQATLTCHNLGGYIIMPKTEQERNFIELFRADNTNPDEVWFGLKEYQSNGIWIWADGTAASGISVGGGVCTENNEDCLRLKLDGTLCDHKCTTSFLTICQRDADQGQFTCLDPDWSLFGASCYKIEGTSTYEQATLTCHNLGGFIIMPKTEPERNFIEFFRADNTNPDEVWFGLKEYQSNGIWIWADGTAASGISVGGGVCTENDEDCLRLKLDGTLCDHKCTTSFLTICQRDADQVTTSVNDITTSPEITTTHSKTSIDPLTTEAKLLQTTSYIDIASSHEITTTNPKTTEGRTTTERDLFGTISAHVSITTETAVESSTSNSASPELLVSKVSSTLSSGIVTNSTEHCNYVFVCSNNVNMTQDSQKFVYRVDTKQLSSYKRKHQSAWDPRKSSLYIGSVGTAVLVLTILLIMFLDCVPTKV